MPGDLSVGLIAYVSSAKPQSTAVTTAQPGVTHQEPAKPPKRKKAFGDTAYQQAMAQIREFRKLDYEKPGYLSGFGGCDFD